MCLFLCPGDGHERERERGGEGEEGREGGREGGREREQDQVKLHKGAIKQFDHYLNMHKLKESTQMHQFQSTQH